MDFTFYIVSWQTIWQLQTIVQLSSTFTKQENLWKSLKEISQVFICLGLASTQSRLKSIDSREELETNSWSKFQQENLSASKLFEIENCVFIQIAIYVSTGSEIFIDNFLAENENKEHLWFGYVCEFEFILVESIYHVNKLRSQEKISMLFVQSVPKKGFYLHITILQCGQDAEF